VQAARDYWLESHAMQVILTRPQQQQAAWTQGLRDEGLQVQSLPLIETAAAAIEAWPSPQAYLALMFVSGNAVDYFYKQKQRVAGIEYASIATNLIVNNEWQPRYWATGLGTVAALQAAGIAPEHIDAPERRAAQFDSEALWQRVRHQVKPGTQVLIVRGRDVDTPNTSRDWLAQHIEQAGGQVTALEVYERRAPVFTPKQLQDAQRWLRDASIWLFSSSQALRHLPAQLDAGAARCVCTHERIAQAARERGFAVVCTSRPVLTDVVASIKSLS
jgi:uroporphyrinogen-III synthase